MTTSKATQIPLFSFHDIQRLQNSEIAMEERFVSSRETTRDLGFFPERGSNNSSNFKKGIPDGLIQKPPLTILDRFRALLREREEDMSIPEDGDFPAPSAEEIVRLYEILLSELSSNSKPMITDLTIIAGEHREHGEGIADAICDRIIEVPSEQKLPSLYLLDSIVKNIGHEYIKYFACRLPEVFCEAFRQVHPNLYPAMRHLFGTWSAVFPSSVRRKIEAELQFSPQENHRSSDMSAMKSSESPSPRSTHGIHINPKYLEARHQLEYSTVSNDVQNGQGISSSLQVYRQKPASVYGEYDIDHSELIPLESGNQALGSPEIATYTSSNKRVDGFVTNNSPGRVVERPSSSLSGFEYCPSRMILQDGEMKDSWLKSFPKDNYSQSRNSNGYNLSNGYDLQRPRALIGAYGNHGAKNKHNEKPLKVELPHVNGIISKAASKSWQNTEEEEYVWEEMSPTVVDRSRSNDLLSSNPPIGSLSTRTALGRSSPTPSGHNFKRDDSSVKAEEGFPIMGGSRYPPDLWNSLHHFPPSSQSRMDSSSANSLNGEGLPTARMALMTETHVGQRTNSLSRAPLIWPPVNVHKSHPPPVLPNMPLPPVVNQDPSKSFLFLGQQLDNVKRNGITSNNLLHLPNQEASLISHNQQSHPQLLKSQVAQNFIPSSAPHTSSQMVAQLQNYRDASQGHGGVMSSILPNPRPLIPSLSSTMHNIPNNSYLHSGILPPLPSGPRPTSFQMGPTPQNLVPVSSHPPPGSAFSGLISSLIGQGLISLTAPASVQDSVGVEFNPDLLKVRHESAISALYADLPRKCTTCGLRFKYQEEHSSHMDWHVTKNRVSKNRKQKPSRKWFISTSVWLSSAEALGTESVPGFLPTEAVIEQKGEEEMAVLADENQNTCALCGEPFDDFYSDETEEWMYRGAVYMNAADGSAEGIDRLQLGPIVHAKCQSESTVASPEEFGVDEWGNPKEGSQRKRMRI